MLENASRINVASSLIRIKMRALGAV